MLQAQETSSVKASKIVDQGIYESDSDSNVHSKGNSTPLIYMIMVHM